MSTEFGEVCNAPDDPCCCCCALAAVVPSGHSATSLASALQQRMHQNRRLTICMKCIAYVMYRMQRMKRAKNSLAACIGAEHILLPSARCTLLGSRVCILCLHSCSSTDCKHRLHSLLRSKTANQREREGNKLHSQPASSCALSPHQKSTQTHQQHSAHCHHCLSTDDPQYCC